MIAWEGTFRIYYNSVKDAPMVWNIDDGCGNNQICIQTWTVNDCTIWGTVAENAEYPYPKAYLMGRGRVEIKNGHAAVTSYVSKV